MNGIKLRNNEKMKDFLGSKMIAWPYVQVWTMNNEISNDEINMTDDNYMKMAMSNKITNKTDTT